MIPDETTFLLSFPCAESVPHSSEAEFGSTDVNALSISPEHGTTAATSTVPFSDGLTHYLLGHSLQIQVLRGN